MAAFALAPGEGALTEMILGSRAAPMAAQTESTASSLIAAKQAAMV